jgi:hypothetical protein
MYARSERRVARSAAVKIEGRSIDSLNIANLRRRVNRTLVVQEVHREAEIEGDRLTIASRYTGYCRANREPAIEFGIDSETNVPFHELECFAYDLRRDPGMEHKIWPILVDADGISKKIAVPFLEPLVARQPFDVLLKCTLPGCMKAGVEYYTSTLSFDQDRVRQCTVRLVFVGNEPDWVRVYECGVSGTPKLLRDLPPVRHTPEFAEYVDSGDDVSAQSTRIYLFHRPNAAVIERGTRAEHTLRA